MAWNFGLCKVAQPTSSAASPILVYWHKKLANSCLLLDTALHSKHMATLANNSGVNELYAKKLAARSSSNLLLTLPFIVFFFVQLIHHQLWRDELNGWGLALASPTLSDLIHNVHYEGHTLLWYLVLWIPARFTDNPIAIKVMEGLVGCSVYLVLGLYSPFSRFEKILIFLSYFVFFEYTVLSRVYGILLLTTLVYLYRRSKHPSRYVENLALLGLLAFVDTLGVMLSFALLAEYAWSEQVEWKARRSVPWRSLGFASAVYFFFLGLAVWSGLPSRQASWLENKPFGFYAFSPTHLAVAITNAVVIPWLPIQHGFMRTYWGDIDVQLQLFILVPVVLSAYYYIFKHHINLLLLMGIVLAECIVFSHLAYESRVRHLGIIFIAFLAALWLQRWGQAIVPDLGKFMLAVSALSGITITALVWTRPFSNAASTAAWLRANHLQNAVLVGTRDFTVASIAIELHRPIYFLECNCSDTYMRFLNRRDSFRWEQIPDRLVIARKRLQAPEMVFLCSSRLTEKEQMLVAERHLHLLELAELTGAGVPEEDFYIYKITS